jgi:hypothetical protein
MRVVEMSPPQGVHLSSLLSRSPFAARRMSPPLPSLSESHRDRTHGNNLPKIITQWQRLVTRKRLCDCVAHCGAGLFGRLRIGKGDERLAHRSAIVIEAKTNRNLVSRPICGANPASLQRATNLTRAGNWISRCSRITRERNRNAHADPGHYDQSLQTGRHVRDVLPTRAEPIRSCGSRPLSSPERELGPIA